MGLSSSYHHILFAKKSRRATRKAEAHHTLVAHTLDYYTISFNSQHRHLQFKCSFIHRTLLVAIVTPVRKHLQHTSDKCNGGGIM